MKILPCLLSFIFTFCFCDDELDEYYLNKGINFLYNYKFELSKNYLDSCINSNPSHPVPYFVKIANKWLDSQINNGYEASYKMINTEVDKVIPIYEELIEKNPKIAQNYLYLGSSYGLQARVDLAKKDWLSVIWSGFKGYSNIQMAKEINPYLYDLYMPIGLMQYFASISPKPIQWVADFIGINPDKKEGLNNLSIAYKKSNYSWIESGSVLAYAYLYFEDNLYLARDISKNLYLNFPNHPYFLYLYAESILRLNELEIFESFIDELKEKPNNYPDIQKNECEIKFNYLMALYFYKNNELNKSIEHCYLVVNNYGMEMDWLLGYNYLLLGKIYDLQGNRGKAKSYYKKVLELDNLFIYDKWASEYIENPFQNIETDPLFIQY